MTELIQVMDGVNTFDNLLQGKFIYNRTENDMAPIKNVHMSGIDGKGVGPWPSRFFVTFYTSQYEWQLFDPWKFSTQTVRTSFPATDPRSLSAGYQGPTTVPVNTGRWYANDPFSTYSTGDSLWRSAGWFEIQVMPDAGADVDPARPRAGDIIAFSDATFLTLQNDIAQSDCFYAWRNGGAAGSGLVLSTHEIWDPPRYGTETDPLPPIFSNDPVGLPQAFPGNAHPMAMVWEAAFEERRPLNMAIGGSWVKLMRDTARFVWATVISDETDDQLIRGNEIGQIRTVRLETRERVTPSQFVVFDDTPFNVRSVDATERRGRFVVEIVRRLIPPYAATDVVWTDPPGAYGVVTHDNTGPEGWEIRNRDPASCRTPPIAPPPSLTTIGQGGLLASAVRLLRNG